jgi:hypothetical protein
MPVIIDGTNGITQAGEFNSDSSFGFKNRIINGAMVLDQRNAGASITPINNQYTLDRWIANITQTGKFTVQQNAGSVTLPVGFSNYLGCTSASAYSVAAGDVFIMNQRIEGFNTADLGWGTANAKTVTLSFQVYSSLTGTFGGSIFNSAENYSYPFSYSIPVANTWTTISVTIAGPTSGTWIGATNGTGMKVNFSLGTGTTYSGTAGSWSANYYASATGATSVVGTNGATFYITGVQLEVGSTATSFDYRPYGTELALCERYCRIYGEGLIGTANTSTTSIWIQCSLLQPMRSSPSLTLKSTAIAISDQFSADYTSSGSVITSSQVSQNGGRLLVSGFTGLTSGRWYGLLTNGSSSPYFIFSAEL